MRVSPPPSRFAQQASPHHVHTDNEPGGEVSRLDDIARAFLRYVYEDSRLRPETGGFLHSRRASELDPPVTVAELRPVLDRLVGQGLITTSGTAGEPLPTRVGLTGNGLICAGPFGGDVASWQGQYEPTRAYQEQETSEARTVPPQSPSLSPYVARTDTNTRETSGGIVRPRSSPEPDTETTREPGLAALERVSRVLLLTLPAVQTEEYSADQHARAVAAELLNSVREPEPDHGRIRDLAERLRAELRSGPIAGTLGSVLLDGLEEALDVQRGA